MLYVNAKINAEAIMDLKDSVFEGISEAISDAYPDGTTTSKITKIVKMIVNREFTKVIDEAMTTST